ncbi:aldehyde dehydrogenase family protein [Pseudonocardia sp. KRD291]|uniref:aldehyde dehydrogenase family protein n=1 Tax=Pseudonocardia sp. KRD291 TaxID=2792007 RepID=UPI0035AFC561
MRSPSCWCAIHGWTWCRLPARRPYGDPWDPQNIAGPQINAQQRDRVLGYIERGRKEGARVVVGRGTARPPACGLLRRADTVGRCGQRHDGRP